MKVTTAAELYQVDVQSVSERSWIDEILQSIRDGDIFYDVGANIGYVSLVIAQRGPSTIRVFAFEPHPGNAAHLLENVRINGAANVTVVQAALGATQGGCLLFDSGGTGLGTHSILASADVGSVSKHRIELMRASDFVQGGRPPPTVVKIDVEGAEWDVLQGFYELLSSSPPREFFIELHHRQLAQQGVDSARVTDFLACHGYEVASMKVVGTESHAHYRARTAPRPQA